MLRIKERAPTPSPSVVFTFGLTVESIEELGGVSYVKCQNTKFIYKKKYELYKTIPIPNEPWENVSMDFMTQLFEWNEMDAIL
jgi:hypothetical protein